MTAESRPQKIPFRDAVNPSLGAAGKTSLFFAPERDFLHARLATAFLRL
jgi:hypothetical protein